MCMTENAPATGSPYSRSDPPSLRPTEKTIGSMTTRPASKKIGKPKMREARPSANGARFSPNLSMRKSAITWAPPLVSTSRPSIAPSPTSRATVARVEPNPAVSTSITDPVGMPATSAVSRLTTMSARKACSLSLMMRKSRSAMAPAAIASSGPAVRVWVQSSGGMGLRRRWGSGVVVRGGSRTRGASASAGAARLGAGEDRVRQLLRRGGDVERVAVLVVGQGLERGELGVEERRRHEVAGTVRHALGEQLGGAREVDEAHGPAGRAQQVAVRALERRARADTRAAGVGLRAQPVADGLEPGPAVVVRERRARGHLVDVRLRVELVGLGVRDAEAVREQRGHGGLARARDAHDDEVLGGGNRVGAVGAAGVLHRGILSVRCGADVVRVTSASWRDRRAVRPRMPD